MRLRPSGQDFGMRYKEALQATDRLTFAKVWHSLPGEKRGQGPNTKRTRFYRTDLLPRVSRKLGLALGSEAFNLKVDFVMWKTKVPWIVIESENTFGDASKIEVPQLCCLAAPVKVLISCCPWEEGEWPKKGDWRGRRNQLLNEWRSIAQRQAQVWRSSGVLGIIIGEWNHYVHPDDKLTFYGLALDSEGRIFDQDQILFHQREMPASPLRGRPI